MAQRRSDFTRTARLLTDKVSYLITGCSGGGKSTLLAELAERGFATVPEAGRRAIATEQASGGGDMPWSDLAAFLGKVEVLARQDLQDTAKLEGPIFFDRGLVDAYCGLERIGEGDARTMHGEQLLYSKTVFVAPPWPEIYQIDDMRQHEFEEACAEYEHILTSLPLLGYRPILLPLTPVEERANFIVRMVEGEGI